MIPKILVSKNIPVLVSRFIFEYTLLVFPRTAYLVANDDEAVPVTVSHDDVVIVGTPSRSPVIFFVFHQMKRSPLNTLPLNILPVLSVVES